MNTDSQTSNVPMRLNCDVRLSAFVLVISALFLYGAIKLVNDGVIEGWFLIVFFGLSGIASFLTVLPGSCYLEIDHDELKIVSLFRERSYPWNQIQEIGMFEVGVVKKIGVDFNKQYQGPERVPDYMKPASGFHLAIPHVSGLELEELHNVLTQCLTAKRMTENPNQISEI